VADEQDVAARPKTPTLRRVKRELNQQRSYAQLETNPFSRTCDRVARVKGYDIARLAGLAKETVRLALVSLPQLDKKTCLTIERSLVPKKVAHRSGLDDEACDRRLFCFKDERVASSLKWFEEALDEAIRNQKADIVCFNELAFPADETGPSTAAIDYVRKIATDAGKLIIGGSFHDNRTLYNSGQIFFPPNPASDSDDIFYHKQVSAIGTFEMVSIPCLRSTTVVEAFDLRIATLICLDMSDYSAVASLFQLGADVDVLLVPSYSLWMEDPLEKIAIDVSSAMPGVVAIVNCYNPSGPSSVVYKFGKKQPERLLPRVPLASGTPAVVSTYDIDLSTFRNERGRRKPKRADRLKSLFGLYVAKQR